jgi:hypothetical protein
MESKGIAVLRHNFSSGRFTPASKPQQPLKWRLGGSQVGLNVFGNEKISQSVATGHD